MRMININYSSAIEKYSNSPFLLKTTGIHAALKHCQSQCVWGRVIIAKSAHIQGK